MKIKINSYGGIPGWFIHKFLSRQLIGIWFFLLQKRRGKKTKMFTEWFVKQKEAPLFQMVEIETINRCNGKCGFCPASVGNEVRPFMKMSEDTFGNIIKELSGICYAGEVLLEVNNEPLIDKRLSAFAKMLKDDVPNCKLTIITNGMLLTVEKMSELYENIDRIIVNNYNKNYWLNENIKKIYEYAMDHSNEYVGKELEIRRRYVDEVLANRAGNAPNHKKAAYNVTMPCLYPFVGITIFPDGRVGLCSNDCLEITDFGNVNEMSLLEIWNGKKIRDARAKISKGRKEYYFCNECDVIGLGTREDIASVEEKS